MNKKMTNKLNKINSPDISKHNLYKFRYRRSLKKPSEYRKSKYKIRNSDHRFKHITKLQKNMDTLEKIHRRYKKYNKANRKALKANDCYVTFRLALNNIFITYRYGKKNKVKKVLSAGSLKIKGYKKSVPQTAVLLIKEFIKSLKKQTNVCLVLKGIFFKRYFLKKIIKEFELHTNITIKSIKVLVPIAHNGLRLKKRKRL